MFGKSNGGAKKSLPTSKRSLEETDIKYPLERIMGLQKALENGIEQDEAIRRRRDLKPCNANTQTIFTNLMRRAEQLLTDLTHLLGYRLRLNRVRRRQYKRTSAR